MIYGFVDEDLKIINKENPLYIQAEYAKKIGKFSLVSLEKESFEGTFPCTCDEKVFLRTTCENFEAALNVLENIDVEPVETMDDVEYIQNWFQLGLTKRIICKMTLEDILGPRGRSWVEKNLTEYPYLFIKSFVKGFSCVVSKDRLFDGDKKMTEFLTTQCALWGKEIMVSGFCEIKKDSLGTKETRHVILNGKVMNSSRQIKSLVHNVPKSHSMKAHEVANTLREIKHFPENYMMDIGEFIDDKGQVYIDIVEINPVSTAMCYLNNSIFENIGNEELCVSSTDTLNMGIEFYNDYIKNPEMYHVRRSSNGHYTYISESHFDFR